MQAIIAAEQTTALEITNENSSSSSACTAETEDYEAYREKATDLFTNKTSVYSGDLVDDSLKVSCVFWNKGIV